MATVNSQGAKTTVETWLIEWGGPKQLSFAQGVEMFIAQHEAAKEKAGKIIVSEETI